MVDKNEPMSAGNPSSEDRPTQKSTVQKAGSSGVEYSRLAGLGFIAFGLLIAAFTAGWVVFQAKRGVAEIFIPKWFIGSGVALAAMGLLTAIFGPKATSIFANMNRGISQVKWYEWLMVIVTGAAGGLAYTGLVNYLETLGYHVR